MDLCRVHVPGAFTTVQDAGRFGFQQVGIPVCGALDGPACRMANLLVGNPAHCAVLELTLTGPRLEFLAEADIALTGAQMDLRINGAPAAAFRSHRLRPADRVEIGQVVRGCRAYLAVSGGIAVTPVMGSRATYVGGRIGGFQGRPLKAGDVLPGDPGALLAAPRVLDPRWIPAYPPEVTLRVVPGPQDDFFDEGMHTLLTADFMVTTKADRMGYRLKGPDIRRRPEAPSSIVSEPSMPGGIQIPADNQPIVLLVEQTVGGYAKIATVISVDLPRLAQATPGDVVRFVSIGLDEARALYQAREKADRQLADTLKAICR